MTAAATASSAPQLQSLLDRAHAQLRARGEKIAPAVQSAWTTAKTTVKRAVDWALDKLGPFADIARTLGRLVVGFFKGKLESWLERRSQRRAARPATPLEPVPSAERSAPPPAPAPSVRAAIPAEPKPAPTARTPQSPVESASTSALVFPGAAPPVAPPAALASAPLRDEPEPSLPPSPSEAKPPCAPGAPERADSHRIDPACPALREAGTLAPASPASRPWAVPDEAATGAAPSLTRSGRALGAPLRGVLRLLATSAARTPPVATVA